MTKSVYSAIEFSSITIGDLADEKSTLVNFTVRKFDHYKEARGHFNWEHEFLVAEMHHPNNSAEVTGVLVIDRENRAGIPDTVRFIPHSSTSFLHILSLIGYHPSNIGRSCEFDSPPSVGEISSILAEKSRAGGEYSSRDKNCYWYANEVFNHCSHSYGGRVTEGPYYNNLGHFKGGAPQDAPVCLSNPHLVLFRISLNVFRKKDLLTLSATVLSLPWGLVLRYPLPHL